MFENISRDNLAESFLQVLMDHAPDLVYYKDSDHRFCEVGETYAEIFDKEPEDLIGKTARDLWPGDVAEAVIEDERHVLRGNPVTDRERKVTHPDGTEHWYSIHKIPHENPDGEIVGFFGIDREITQRKRQAREARRFKRAVEAAGHGVYITDPDAVIRYVNPAFEEITGFSEERAVGENPRIMKSGEMSEDYYEDLWSTILDANIWDREIINQRRNGETYTAHQTIAPITNGDDEIRAFVAIQSDISARRNLEQRLSVLNRVLRHDIRSAVSILRGNAQLAQQVDDDPEAFIETIQDETDRLYDLSEKARTIQKLSSDETKRLENVNLTTLVRAKAHKYQNEYDDLSVRTSLPDSATVRASPHLEEALDQLFYNAITHNDRDKKQIELCVETGVGSREWTQLEVCDNGPGIPEDEIEPIQEGRETQIHHTSGLGLWVVYWIVEASGGEIEFGNRACGGTNVTLRFRAEE